MGSQLLTQWMALAILEGSDMDPEITEWDDTESAKRKARAKAKSGAKWKP